MNEFQKKTIKNICLAVGIPTAIAIEIALCIIFPLYCSITLWLMLILCLLASTGLILIASLEWYYKFKLKGCVTKYEELQYIDKYFIPLVRNKKIEDAESFSIDFISKAREVKPPRILKWFYDN